MRVIMVMFDSLNRHMLSPYAPDTWVHTPNFQRLAQRSVTFDRSYVCSMPCMPARRDLHTGRPNFLHVGWGPLEPFDDSVPAMLAKTGVYTHLASDHYHYWEDGGATYHTRYNSWEFFRGQEGDPFIGQVREPHIPPNLNGKGRRPDWVNREHVRYDDEFSQTQTFKAGLQFIDRNHDQDRWFLQIECFDPHEPFCCDRQYKDLYPSDYDGPLFDWPSYRAVEETPEQVQEARRNYAALMTKCDRSLGHVLDAMDRYQMWDDTMLILWTDHGYMLGEHNAWAKNWMPLYEEIAHTPFFVWDPRAKVTNQRRSALVQPSIDLGPTLLEFFGLEPTASMTGKPLRQVIERDEPVRDAAIFGYFSQGVNLTDGRYVYMRQSVTQDNSPIHAYTLMPTSMRGFKMPTSGVELAPPFSFTRNMPLLKWGQANKGELKPEVTHTIYDLRNDPKQESPVQDEAVEQQLIDQMTRLMAEADAPPEQYQRLGLPTPAAVQA